MEPDTQENKELTFNEFEQFVTSLPLANSAMAPQIRIKSQVQLLDSAASLAVSAGDLRRAQTRLEFMKAISSTLVYCLEVRTRFVENFGIPNEQYSSDAFRKDLADYGTKHAERLTFGRHPGDRIVNAAIILLCRINSGIIRCRVTSPFEALAALDVVQSNCLQYLRLTQSKDDPVTLDDLAKFLKPDEPTTAEPEPEAGADTNE